MAQSQCVDTLNGLQEHLITIEDLQQKFTSYQLSYNKMLLEIGRRGQYREAAAVIVRRMIEELAAMTEGLCPPKCIIWSVLTI
jgi:autophagy-related protein 17